MGDWFSMLRRVMRILRRRRAARRR